MNQAILLYWLGHWSRAIIFLTKDIENGSPHTAHRTFIEERPPYLFKLVKDAVLLSSYKHISVLDMIEKLFEEILLAKLIRGVSVCVLLRDEGFGSDTSIASLCSRLTIST